MNRVVAVAASGGRDSTALLHAVLQTAQALGVQVLALHVHHGLHPQADAWRDHLKRLCRRWAAAGSPVTFHERRLAGAPAAGDSVEAWARRGRYAALAEMAREHGASLVLLAHHRRDQAETFLLQALRGAGMAGLAAMPRRVERDGITWARPWLDMPRTAVEAYVKRHRLRVVDDPSNADPRFARSRLRVALWPVLEEAFPAAEATLAAAARHAQQARQALDELARADLAGATEGVDLLLPRWQALPSARRAFALRAWLQARTGRGTPDSLIDRLLDELPAAGRPARWPLLPGMELQRFRGRLRLATVPPDASPRDIVPLHIRGPGVYPAPRWRGALVVTPVEQGGVALAGLARCELRPRAGAEQFQAAHNRPARSLKKQFQAAAVAPWQRDAPLLFCDNRLVFVPGLGIDAAARAQPGQPQVRLEWVSDV